MNDAESSNDQQTGFFREGELPIVRIARAFEHGGDPSILRSQMRSLKAPVSEIQPALEELKKIDQSTLINLLSGSGDWIPIILDALSDRKLAKVLKVVFGTFCTDVLPPSITGYSDKIPYPSLFPGRSACGGTNLQPLFDMLATTPVSTIKKALPIIRKSDSCDEDAPYYLTHLLDIKYRRPKRQGETSEIFFELTRRIPIDIPDRDALLSSRATSLALDYFNRVARTTVASDPAFRHLRALVCAHAESSGFQSVNAALLDFSRRWISSPTYEVSGYTLHKAPHVPEGHLVMKGGKTLKTLPPALRKDESVTLFRAEAFALWQVRLSFEDEALSRYIESGEMLENQEFFDVFGFQPSSMIRKGLTTRIPENLENEILSLLKNNTPNDHPLSSIPPITPRDTFPEMIRRGWEHWFRGKGTYGGIYSQYPEPGNTSNIVIEIKPLNPREDPWKEMMTPPETLQSLIVSRDIRWRSKDWLPSAPNERVLGLILRDLVEVFLAEKL